MPYLTGWVVVGAWLLGGAFCPAGEEPKQAAELKWAREVASDFFKATAESPTDAAGLLSPELAKSVLADHVNETFLAKICMHGYRDWKITSEEVSPNADEIIFCGVVKAPNNVKYPDADFKLRVAKEPETGRWSIRYMVVRERWPEEKKTDKPDNAKKIIGSWECTKADEGKSEWVGGVLIFRDDGTFETTYEGKTEKGKYKISDRDLELLMTNDDGELAAIFAVSKLSDTELVIKTLGKKLVWKRKNPVNSY
jgi:hypothetical protein